MATVKRIDNIDMAGAKLHQCSECEEEFVYGSGFPEYCPECGALFTDTEDAKEAA